MSTASKSSSPIDELINRLAAEDKPVEILEFIALAAEVLNKELDLGFAAELQELVFQGTCCVPHDLLVKYGVLTGANVSAHVVELMKQYGFIEGVDYSRCGEKAPSGGGRGRGRPQKKYCLHPRTFKKCIMRARNTSVYADYYVLLEECVMYFQKYRHAVQNNFIVTLTSRHQVEVLRHQAAAQARDEKIDRLESMLAEMRAESQQRAAESQQRAAESQQRAAESQQRAAESQQRADANAARTDKKLDAVIGQNDELKTALVRTEAKVDKVATVARTSAKRVDQLADRLVAAADSQAPLPDDERKAECLALVALSAAAGPALEYVVVRVQSKMLASRLAALRRANEQMRVVLQLSPVPNARTLWTRVREALDGALVFASTDTARARFTLAAATTEAALVAAIREVFDGPVARATRRARAEKVVTAGQLASVARAVTKTILQAAAAPPPPAGTLTDADIDELLGDLLG